jgi:PAP2 superfamily
MTEHPHGRDGHPAPAIAEAIDGSLRRGLLREVLLVGAAIVAYFVVRNVTAGGADDAFANARRLVDLEEWLHIAWEDAVQDAIVGSDTLVTLTNWVYIWLHWPVILGTAVALWVWRRPRYHLFRNALFVSGAIGFLFFALFPVAPPRLLDLGLVDTVTEQSRSYRALQPPGLTNQYAALPSLHVGWNFVVGIVLFTTFTALAVRIFAVVSPLAMTLAVVATANHFVIDVVAGLAVVLVGLTAAVAIQRRGDAATLDPRGPEARADSESGHPSPVPRRAPGREPSRGPPRG